MRRNVFIAVLVTLSVGVAAPRTADSETSGKKIALTNSTDAGAWHQAMLKSWQKVSVGAVQDGLIKETAVYPTAEKAVAEQERQIRNLMQQGYDAIVVNAASRDGLNGVIKEACDAGIVVVSFDGVVSEPCAWRLSVDYRAMGKAQIEYLKEVLPDGGNLLEIRGRAGTPIDDAIHAGIEQGLRDNPQFKVIGSARGNWDQEGAKKAVTGILGSLPEVKAVVTQGGDGFGTAQAFAAAGRPTPIIIMGNRDVDLKWWKEQKDASGYKTMSASLAPSVSNLAFWVAQMILDGRSVEKDLRLPLLRITQDNLDATLEKIEKGGTANVEYSSWDAKKVIAGTK
jgi:ribose transport system substrate-binding protein